MLAEKMAGWLGANFSSQIDQLKKGVSQVSTIVKDTLVVDDTWDRDIDENGSLESERTHAATGTPSKEESLEEKCTRLDGLYRVSILKTVDCELRFSFVNTNNNPTLRGFFSCLIS